MKCANVAFSVLPRIGDGDAEKYCLSSIWSSVFTYVWHRLLFLPLGFTSNTWHESDRLYHRVCPSVRSSVVSL